MAIKFGSITLPSKTPTLGEPIGPTEERVIAARKGHLTVLEASLAANLSLLAADYELVEDWSEPTVVKWYYRLKSDRQSQNLDLSTIKID